MITSHIQTTSPAPAVVSPPAQDKVNRSVYHSPGVYRYYLSKLLTPPEIACLLKYQPCIAGRDVLDIGVGAGRTARYLAPLARHYHGVDYSPVMVGYMRKTMREISVDQADFRDLHIFDDQSFDFVFATDNVIDALAHEDRLRALSEACRVLRAGGVMAFSSHNIRYKTAFAGPQFRRSSNPVRLAANCVRYVQSWRNHLRVAPLRKTTADYALLNDPGHLYACLHYYASRSIVSSQVARAGMALIEAFDTDGRVAPDGEDDSENPSLMYVAQRPHTR
jgi:SAM-dependent methyltransferase